MVIHPTKMHGMRPLPLQPLPNQQLPQGSAELIHHIELVFYQMASYQCKPGQMAASSTQHGDHLPHPGPERL